MTQDLREKGFQAMKEAGIVATTSRLEVWRSIAQADRPLKAVEIKRRLVQADVDIPLSSIYAALSRLVSAKMLSTYTIDGATHYYSPAQNFCQRIVCVESGKEYWFADQALGQAIDAFCKKHGFSLADYSLSIQGRRTRAKASRRSKK